MIIESEEQLAKENAYTTAKAWFAIFSVVFVFGLFWTMIGELPIKLAFVTVAFGLFLYSLINMEMKERDLHHGHH